MNVRKLVAVILIAVGIVALVYQGITYTTSEDVVDLGPLEITTQEKETIPLPPVVGVIAIAGGVVLLLMGGRRE